MNKYQRTLFENLMSLVNKNEAFYYNDIELDEQWFRLFNYRLASYTDFLEPDALECRGHMFQISEEGEDAEMLRLVSLPPEKFFNLHENPFTMEIDPNDIVAIEEKADGSLISTYAHLPYGGDSLLKLKSKGSLSSDQANDAMRWLALTNDNRQFYHELYKLAVYGYTVNMEWISPDNRIVIGYPDPELRVLNIRNNMNGQYVYPKDIHDSYQEVCKRWVDDVDTDGLSLPEFVESIPEMTGIEGYVVRLNTGQRIKIKTKWYLALHHTKDSINSPRRLFEACLEEATDDMKSMFYDDQVAIKMITDMEQFVEQKYNHMVDTVERFYERNKHLERKEYAILGQEELDRMYFGLAMQKYTGRQPDYKGFLKKKWKELGLKDKEENEDE